MSYYARVVEAFVVYALLVLTCWALVAGLVFLVGWVLF